MKPILDSVLGVVNTGLSLIKDKTASPDDSFIHEKVKNGVSISSKRALNIGGTGAIVSFALMYLAGDDADFKKGIALLGIGVVYSVAMSFITAWSEKNKSKKDDNPSDEGEFPA